jgi:hypothetical protein
MEWALGYLLTGFWDEDNCHYSYANGRTYGSVPPWLVLPLNPDIYARGLEHFKERRGHYGTELLSENFMETEPNEWIEPDLQRYYSDCHHPDLQWQTHDDCQCMYGDLDQPCSCGQRNTGPQQQLALVFTPITAAHLLTDELLPAWDHALHRYLDGWEAIEAQAQNGDPWSISSSQRLSPFSVTSSPQHHRRVLSAPSTPSATSLAS